MTGLEPVIFSGITVIPLVHCPVILNGITRSHSAGLAGHFERDYAFRPKKYSLNPCPKGYSRPHVAQRWRQ